MSYEVAELKRKLQNIIRRTTISSVDESTRTVRVLLGKDESAPLPWPADIGKHYRRWIPLQPGIPCIIGCEGGDPANAVILRVMYSNAHPTPSNDPDVEVIEYTNGNRIEHDHNSGEIRITAKGNVIVNGDVIADGISLINHVHKDVTAGKAKTGKPA